MGLSDLTQWFDRYSGPECIWIGKRLTGDDTLANGSRQPGPRIPEELLFDVIPSLKENKTRAIRLDLSVDSHGADRKQARGVFDRDKHCRGVGGEFQITEPGGSRSALLDPENTGALTIFAFVLDEARIITGIHVWVCRNEAEEELAECWLGPVEPGYWVTRSELSGLKTILPPFAANL